MGYNKQACSEGHAIFSASGKLAEFRPKGGKRNEKIRNYVHPKLKFR